MVVSEGAASPAPAQTPPPRTPFARSAWVRAARSWPDRLPLARLAAAVALVAGLLAYVAAFREIWIDDAYIQMRYARTLLVSGTWGFYPGYPANTATSPLNVLLLAAAGLPLGTIPRAVTVLTALELAALLGLLLRLSHRLFARGFFGWFAFVAVAANPLLLSTIGMESVLYALLLVAAVTCFLEDRWLPMGVALGLLTLARPDGVLLLAVLLPLTAAPLRRKAGILLAYAATTAPWFLFSWIALGSFVPDTFVIKTAQGAWGPSSFADGLAVFLDNYPLATLGSLFLVPLCLFPLWRCGADVVKLVTVLATYGALHFALYAALGVPPYHWYFIHQLVPLLLIAAVGATSRVARLPAGPAQLLPRVALLVPAAGLLALAVADGFPLDEAPINSNWATSGQYREIGLWMRDNLGTLDSVAIRGEIGTVAYYSGRYMVNEFSDMSIADDLIERANYEARPGTGPLWAFNFRWRRDHRPLPAPRYEFVALPPVADAPQCPVEDPGCRYVREGTTTWVGRIWLMVRSLV